MNRRLSNILVVAGMSLCGLAWSVVAVASEKAPPTYWQLSNEYIGFALGTGGTVDFKIGDTSFSWAVPGRFSVFTTAGDPELVEDDSLGLIAWGMDEPTEKYSGGQGPCHKFGYWKVKVGNNVPSIIGVSGGSWTAGPVIIDPPPGLGIGKNGPFLGGTWTTADKIDVEMRVYLVRDQVRFEFTLKNQAAVAQTVGLQMVGVPLNPLQGDIFGAQLTGFEARPFVPGIGRLDYGRLIVGRNIPPTLELFDDIQQPKKVARLTFSGQDATFPDRIALGEGSDLAGDLGTTGSAIDGDALNFWLCPTTGLPNGSYTPPELLPGVPKRVVIPAWAVCWERKNVAVGGSRKIVAYYGVGVSSGAWTTGSGSSASFDSAGLFIQGSRALSYNATDPARVSDLSPNAGQFTITGYVYNYAKEVGVYDLGNVRLSLLLPDGLTLIGGDATQGVGYLPDDNIEGFPVTWTVQATGEVSGDIQYFVQAKDIVSGWNQLVTRTIHLPAADKSTLKGGWQMMSAPFEFSDPDPMAVFGKNIRPQFWSVWLGGTGVYKPVTALQPGQGFWAYVTDTAKGPYTLPAKRIYGELNGTQGKSISIDLTPGWNLIGSPYVLPIYWEQAQVYDRSTNLFVPLDKAVTKYRWLSRTIFSWNSDLGKYDYSSDALARLEPWKSYWVRAYKAVTLYLFPTDEFPGSTVSAPSGG